MDRYIVISLLYVNIYICRNIKKKYMKKSLYAHSVFARTFRDPFAHVRSLDDYSRIGTIIFDEPVPYYFCEIIIHIYGKKKNQDYIFF